MVAPPSTHRIAALGKGRHPPASSLACPGVRFAHGSAQNQLYDPDDSWQCSRRRATELPPFGSSRKSVRHQKAAEKQHSLMVDAALRIAVTVALRSRLTDQPPTSASNHSTTSVQSRRHVYPSSNQAPLLMAFANLVLRHAGSPTNGVRMVSQACPWLKRHTSIRWWALKLYT